MVGHYHFLISVVQPLCFSYAIAVSSLYTFSINVSWSWKSRSHFSRLYLFLLLLSGQHDQYVLLSRHFGFFTEAICCCVEEIVQFAYRM